MLEFGVLSFSFGVRDTIESLIQDCRRGKMDCEDWVILS